MSRIDVISVYVYHGDITGTWVPPKIYNIISVADFTLAEKFIVCSPFQNQRFVKWFPLFLEELKCLGYTD